MITLKLDGRSLRLEDIENVAFGADIVVQLDEDAKVRMRESRALIEELVLAGEPVYGVTTGFGRLADVAIAPENREALQHNLVRSHASGMGDPLDSSAVRALMLLRANALSRGHSGCRVEVVELLLGLLNAGIHPRVPEFGSVGASGDLAPLAHVALALLGEGRAEHEGVESDVGPLMADAGLQPMRLGSKEGLALINGTQATTGIGILALLAAERAVECAEVAGAMSMDALLGTPEPFRQEIQDARPHAGQGISAGRLRALVAGSEIRESHR
ncbi:MAG: aromatic amino acid lyase, partial [Gemmatimonadales bacterium]|nr:aromatic amino acid lyase [Gemmatimonadales bacterium]